MDITTEEIGKLSIVIPYHNESRSTIQKCVDQLLDTIDVEQYEVIIVDDGSYKPLDPIEGTTIIRHKTNQGVGTAFDTGVKSAKYDNLFLMGNDIRFIKNGWASKMVDEIENHPQAFTCTTCVRLGRGKLTEVYETDIEKQLRNKKYGIGATIKMISSESIIDAQWLPIGNRTIDEESYEVPCILGAAYGVKKDWYNYIGGWEGHRGWGTLEPMISIKSWLFGGSCRVAPRIQVGHIFNIINKHGVHSKYISYNKILTALLFIPNPDKMIVSLGDKNNRSLDKLFSENRVWIDKKIKEYQSKTIFSFEEYCKKFNIHQPTQK
jgi:glycosyltransferase involved in cell wall biosynthesis